MKKPKTLDTLNLPNKIPSSGTGIIKDEKADVVSKTIRIYEKDYEIIREIAFKEKKRMVEVVQEAIAMFNESKGGNK